MQRLTGTFEQSGKPSDNWHKVELPDRSSTYTPPPHTSPPQTPLPHTPLKEDGTVSPATLASPGLESMLTPDSTEKEAYRHSTRAEKEIFSHDCLPEYDEGAHNRSRNSRNSRRKWLFAILGIIAFIAIGLGVGLGVGLTRKR